ncbi:MAG: molybdate ABC transporter permease subunit [Deltaproteobacteria bacterium]|nr:molybdate ABC transporter permease subunit [Deltaproteobacteria bacterium]
MMSPIILSIAVSFAATIICAPMAWCFASLVVRRRFPGRMALDAMLNLPLVLPPLVTGYFLLVVFGGHGMIGRYLDQWLGLRLAFTTAAAVIAAMTVAFPLFYRAVKLSLESMDRRMEDIAATLGATRWDILWSITVPLNWRGLVTGAVTTFARSLGEFGATIIFAANIPGKTQTIPLAVFNYINTPGGDAKALPLIVIATLISAAAMASSYYLAPDREPSR